MLSKYHRKNWFRNRAWENNPELKHSNERFIHLFFNISADNVKHFHPQILEQFTQNLLFFCLSCCNFYDTPSVLDILERNQNEWLQPFLNRHTDLSEPLTTADFAMKQQTISLFRCLLEFSGGNVDFRQHDFGVNYMTNENVSLCANFLGVFNSRQFKRFDPKKMQGAFFKSKFFAEFSMSDFPNTVEWSRRMMMSVPVGFSKIYLIRCYRNWDWRTLTMI